MPILLVAVEVLGYLLLKVKAQYNMKENDALAGYTRSQWIRLIEEAVWGVELLLSVIEHP